MNLHLCSFGLLLLLLTLHQSQCSPQGSNIWTLEKCLNDTDYANLMNIAEHGVPKTKRPYHVVIVGAGMAGLTAAKLLKDAGYNVTILEASERVGGRVLTYRNEQEGWYVEFGAMRIPSTHYILHKFIQQLKIPLNKFNMTDNNTYFLINGKLHKTLDVKKNYSILDYNVTENEKNKSADELLQEALKKVKDEVTKNGCIAALKKFDPYSVKDYLQKETNLSTEAIRMIGDILNEDSIMSKALSEMIFVRSDVNDSVQYTEVTGGMDRIPNALYQNLTNVKVKFNAPVKKIKQSNNTVTVFYQSNETQSLSSVTADAVLVTTSAKAAFLMDFEPPLPPPKWKALRSVHYGSSTKVILTFSERFWEKEGIYGGKSVTDRPSRFIYYPSHGFPGNKTIGVLLASYIWGEDSLLLLSLNDDKVKELVLKDLKLIHPNINVRSLCTGVLVKKWSLDSLSHGAFALFDPYQHLEFARELFKKEGRIYFAGEHTGFPHAWIETAMKSAIRAANNIAKEAQNQGVSATARDEL